MKPKGVATQMKALDGTVFVVVIFHFLVAVFFNEIAKGDTALKTKTAHCGFNASKKIARVDMGFLRFVSAARNNLLVSGT